MRKTKSDILETVHETATGLHKAGAMDRLTLCEFDPSSGVAILLRELKSLGFVEVQWPRSPPGSVGIQIAHCAGLYEAHQRALQFAWKPVRGLKDVCKVSRTDASFAG